MSTRVRVLAAAVTLLLTLTACGGTAEQTQTDDPTDAATTAAEGGEAAQPASVEQIRIAGLSRFGYPSPFAWVRGPGWIMAGMIFDTLVWEDSTGEPIPWLADDWEQSDDGLTWTFTLNEDAAWHDGEPVTAEDVVFTVDYMTTGDGAEDASWAADGLEIIEEATAVDEHTVEFQLERPSAVFLEEVAMSVLIVPEHVWSEISEPGKERGELATMGSGPYQLESIDEASGAVLMTANEDFYRQTPVVRRIEMLPVEDELLALQRGELDAAGTPLEEPVPESQLAAFDEQERFARLDQPGSWNRALHFNLDAGFPYDTQQFRQAIAYAIDRQDLVERILGGRGSVGSTGAMAPAHPWTVEDLPTYEHDVEQANAMLDDLGLVDADDDGFRELRDGSEWTQDLMSSTRFSTQTPELIKEHLREVGIDVEIEVLDQAAADEAAAQGNYTMTMVGYGGLMGDADRMRQKFQCDAPISGHSTLHGYCNERIDELGAEQLVTTDPEARRGMIAEMQEIVAEELPILSLYVPDNTLFYDQTVFDDWYYTPGCSPCGGTRNRHMYVTGRQTGF